MLNALTIDVEDYWDVFSRDWLGVGIEPTDAVVKNTEWFLGALERFNVKGTFFVLANVADTFPSLIRKVAEAGHEIGSHGCSHAQVFRLNRETFRSEVARSKRLIEDVVSRPIFGYRAPAFSITPATKWALEVLAEEGFKYDSSVFPIAGRRYGWRGFSKTICNLDLPSGANIIEVPMSTIRILCRDWPVGGGGYLRHFPYAVTKWALKEIQRQRSVVVYMHPYDIDTEQRFFETRHLSCKERKCAVKHHKMQLRNRNTVGKKLIRLLSDYEFVPVRELIDKTVLDSYRVQ
jgi:polysaccharide deacetylase family protein (PEP-CTERM system associated)